LVRVTSADWDRGKGAKIGSVQACLDGRVKDRASSFHADPEICGVDMAAHVELAP
jgi:hypothetical protein